MSESTQCSRKKLGFNDCMGLAIGQIIGSGVMVLTGIVVGLTGHGTPLAYLFGAVLAILNAFPYIILTSTIPASGAGYVYSKRLLGDKAGFMYIGMFVLSQVLIATYALGLATYFCAIYPQFNLIVVAMAALIICTVINLIGLKSSAMVQKVIVLFLMISLFLFIVFGLPKVEWSNLVLTTKNVMPSGIKSFLTGVALLSFACGGAKYIAENGDDIVEPDKTVPKVIIISTSLVAVFYALIGCIASGVLPLEQVAFKNLTVVAKEIFPPWVYIFFVFGGAIFALFTTLNGTLSWVTRGLQAAAKDGWLPEKFAVENKAGVPYIILGIFFVIGAVPILSGLDLTMIASMGVGTDAITGFMMIVVCWKLPDMFPEAYQKSAFYLKKNIYHIVLVFIGFLTLGTTYVSLSELTGPAAIACALYILFLIVLAQFRYKHVVGIKQKKANLKLDLENSI